jgi:hypothetical protein
LGRYLLGWYLSLELLSCFSAAYSAQLPLYWRVVNVQIRQELSRREYPRLPKEVRASRLLDDLWAEYWLLVSSLEDIQQLTLQLNTTNETARKIEIAMTLEERIRTLTVEVKGILESEPVVEVLMSSGKSMARGRGVSTFSNHVGCCPPLPYLHFVTDFPPAGFLRYVHHGVLAYMHDVLLPNVHSILNTPLPPRDPTQMSYAVEICRTFAGLEASFVSNPDFLIPCFPGMISAAMTVPPGLRNWVWAKLQHFERSGEFQFEGVKKSIAALWNMPEILKPGYSWAQRDDAARLVEIEDDETDREQKVNREVDEVEDEELESLAKYRGLFGMTSESS